MRRGLQAVLVVGAFTWFGSMKAADPDPKIMTFQRPDQVKWTDKGNGLSQATLYGDPDKPGLYIIKVRWAPHSMSHPHYHPNDRLVTVLKGTWWVGWGPKYDPNSTSPMPAGSYVRHIAKGIHYDGAKDAEVILEIVGQGPETSTPAEQK